MMMDEFDKLLSVRKLVIRAKDELENNCNYYYDKELRGLSNIIDLLEIRLDSFTKCGS